MAYAELRTWGVKGTRVIIVTVEVVVVDRRHVCTTHRRAHTHTGTTFSTPIASDLRIGCGFFWGLHKHR